MASEEPVTREVAWRVFASEYDDSTLSFKAGDDERAPNYVVTPTGARVNRLFAVGVVTEVEEIGDDYYRIRLSDPTATFMVYAGQYQPEAVSFFSELEPPEFVAVVGKANTYSPDDSDEIYTSVRPEEVNGVDAATRDRWNVETARQTIARVDALRAYLAGDDSGYVDHRPRLHDASETVGHYDVDESYLEGLRERAFEVIAEVAGVDAGDAGSGSDVEPAPESTEPADAAAGMEREESAGAVANDAADADEPASGAAATEAEEAADVEPGAAEDGPSESLERELEDVPSDDAEWEWDEGERERVAEEYGDEFESAAEIDDGDAGEAGEAAEAEADEADGTVEAGESAPEDVETAEESGESGGTEGEDEPRASEADADSSGADVDAQSLVMEVIESEGAEDGVERSVVVERAVDAGATEQEAEDALDQLLLEGMCYPTDGDRIKPL
ncbi:MAG: hypothetical protein ACLFMT_01960 [Halobacteriales archaeon]